MDLFDIFMLEQAWNGCDDMRPWLVVSFQPGGIIGCFPIATHCYTGDCFYLDQNHPDFAATGLKHSCHIHDSHIHDVDGNLATRRRGGLKGELLAGFMDHAGFA